MHNSTTILLAGATGRVGNQIAQSLLRRNVNVRLLIRPQSVDNSILKPLIQYGATIAKGDVLDTESLKPAVEDVDIIMSALRGNRKLIVDGQVNLAQAAKEAGVQRLFPSTFSSELFYIDTGDDNIVNNKLLAMRREAADAIKTTGLPATHVMNGTFMNSMINFPPLSPFRLREGTFEYWGDGQQMASYTTLHDAVAYAVEAALSSKPPTQLRVAGDTLSLKEMKSTYERVTGQKLTERHVGSIDDLRDKISQLKADAESPMDYVFHQICYSIAIGGEKLKPLDNGLYPSLNPKTFEDFLSH